MSGRNLKILGLSLLALVGVMAVSASAAQAKWLLLRNNVSVLQLNLAVEALLGELLVEEIGLEIHCEGGTGTVTATLNGAHTTLTGDGLISFDECTVLDSPFCTVNSPGDDPGLIHAEGSGTAGMNGNNVIATLVEEEEFAEIEISGDLCPLNETLETVNGSVDVTLLNPTTEAALHLAHIDENELFFGEHEAQLHDAVDPGSDVEAHISEATGANWAITLVGL